MATADAKPPKSGFLLNGSVLTLLLAAILALCLFAPTEETTGDAQRIVYVHVAVAWLGLLGLLTMAAAGAMYLARRDLSWDQWAQSAAELGWLCCGSARGNAGCCEATSCSNGNWSRGRTHTRPTRMPRSRPFGERSKPWF